MQSGYVLLVALATLVFSQETSGSTLSFPSTSPLDSVNEQESNLSLRRHTEDHAVDKEERAPTWIKKLTNLADLGNAKLPDLGKFKLNLPDWEKIAGYGKATDTASKLLSTKSDDSRLEIISGVKDIDEMKALFAMSKPFLKKMFPDYDDTTSLEALSTMIKNSDLKEDVKALALLAFQRYADSVRAGTSKLDVSP
ncbi:secreted RxLR effector peptide protein, putative [Phytophthora infestans T30-4]|uniref:Secreted RxLR effector peptide protein, putative n=2 Tax=Phytophthora infestans TaxID=4787 RepID=D0N9K6_PHYIT|nr:secreted RxLR effector peptide protein, putative [Phytophthora infestans T30-4]EEY54494.1 secreted RxLR effector peptide protein, putative [Phytophthora infestans T30-4]KAF4028040.1 hypothetical protein GN244_ATG20297 [Phytophthora infestans]KAF4146077.1 hypothetical protein GN958_ATG04743 [Phytophthora infestans]|eukprot:XP_002904316.1 secreted RxLR effector peptide protein, putative [Phytophthora infestans T30-4]